MRNRSDLKVSAKASAEPAWLGQLACRTKTLAVLVVLTLTSACGDGPIPPVVTETVGNWHAAWSPNGDEIAFVHRSPGEPEAIWAVNVSTGTMRRIAVTGHAAYMEWNADGSRLALSIGMGAYILDVSSGQLTPLADFPAIAPSFSPINSDLIVFTSLFVVHEGLWLRNISSGDVRRVPLPFYGLNHASWAPDGRRIVAEDVKKKLFVTDTLGVDTAYITDGSPLAEFPTWSPKGDWIAYVESTGTSFGELWLVRPDGSGRHRLVKNASMPSWNPLGSQIVFTRVHQDGSVTLHIVDLAGKERPLVTAF